MHRKFNALSSTILTLLLVATGWAENPSSLDSYQKTGRFGELWGDGIPIHIDAVAMERGRTRYMANCAICHGMEGTSSGGPTDITSLMDPRVRMQPDGELFDIITNGRKKMNGFSPALTDSDRWKVVAFVRTLQHRQNQASGTAPIPLPTAMANEMAAIKQKQPPTPVKNSPASNQRKTTLKNDNETKASHLPEG
ncbi:MAG: hypothetical protein B9S32_14535 [Verrucomicrobia bacterium Tous-C9LFEB]|nr:MAG: hypothetical protein B9S32_14535 [Verrucomicrobia bacterium Tous-C9LFEB]